jgi:hypothetical protein
MSDDVYRLIQDAILDTPTDLSCDDPAHPIPGRWNELRQMYQCPVCWGWHKPWEPQPKSARIDGEVGR